MSICPRRKPFSIPGRRPKRGFTLVELLAVIAIIAVLVVLISSVLGRMRKSSQKTACLANIRQIGTAMHAYTADNDGRMPWFHDGNTPPTHWQKTIGVDYLGENKATYDDPASILRSPFHCAADRTASTAFSPSRPTRNIAINGARTPTAGATVGVTGRKVVAIQNPARVAMVGDGASAEFSAEWGYGGRWYNMRNLQADVEQFARHDGFMNVMFVDGHAESVTKEFVVEQMKLDANSVFFDKNGQY